MFNLQKSDNPATTRSSGPNKVGGTVKLIVYPKRICQKLQNIQKAEFQLERIEKVVTV